MKIFSDKKKLIQLLFGLAFVLLAANIITSKFSRNHYTSEEKARSSSYINLKLRSALTDYGIKDEWISRKKRTRSDDDSLLYKYKIEVPNDLPVVLLLDEIENSFESDSVIVSSKELKFGGPTILKIYSGDNLKLQAEFNYRDDIKREAGTVGLIITGAEQLNAENFAKLLKLPESFSILLLPSRKSVDLQGKIISAQKEVAVLISDETTNLDYKMKAGFSSDRIRNSIRAIISDFAQDSFFVIDDKSALYFSAGMKIIENELKKAKVKFFKSSQFKKLSDKNADGYLHSFDELVKTSKNKKIVLQLTSDKLYSVQQELKKFRRVGYKFLKASVVLE